MNEKEISIVDLVAEILLHWRTFIIWMIAGAMLFGAYGYVRSGNIAKQQQNPEEWLTEEEIQYVRYLVNYERLYFAKGDYQEKSPLMQIDFNHVSKAEATIAVDTADFQKSCDIAKAYMDIVESGELIIKVAEDIGMEAVGVNEILYLDREAGNGNTNVILDSGERTDTFKITVAHSDKETCKDILKSALAFLEEKQSDIENALGEHELIVVNESFGVVSDTDIADLQEKVLDNIAEMKKTISDGKKGLSEAEQMYYDFLIIVSEKEAEETVMPEAVPSPGISVKYALLGVFVTVFIYGGILLLVYIFNTKIRAAESLQELYGIQQLGMIPKEPGKKKVLGIVDKWILSIRNHNKRQFSPEEALELAAVAVKMAAGKETLEEICLMGCDLKERSLDTCGKIKARIEDENIHAKILNNVLYDAQMLEELEGAKGVVLVERAGATLYHEIAEELELLKRQDIKVLGGILVE